MINSAASSRRYSNLVVMDVVLSVNEPLHRAFYTVAYLGIIINYLTFRVATTSTLRNWRSCHAVAERLVFSFRVRHVSKLCSYLQLLLAKLSCPWRPSVLLNVSVRPRSFDDRQPKRGHCF
ncbi:hypothetical protein M758_1G028500 [Ceratodon purpureus]|nr:hypothetical protein M758_1G028500 [Ceratodon purpureus]